MIYLSDILFTIVLIPFAFAVIFVHIPSVLLLLALILAGWFYKTRVLLWSPIGFAAIMIPILMVGTFSKGQLPMAYYDFIFWGSSFFDVIMLLFPILGLIFSKIKNKKADKIFWYAFLINFVLLIVMMITNWHFYTYMP